MEQSIPIVANASFFAEPKIKLMVNGELFLNIYTHIIAIIPKIMEGGGQIDLLTIVVEISNTEKNEILL